MTTATVPGALVREFYRLVDANDVPGLAALFTVDAEYRRPGYPPLAGRDAIERFYVHDRVIAAGRHVLDAVLVDGDRAAVAGSFTGELKDGGPVTHRFAEFFRLAPDGRVSQRETFFAVAHV
jgi:steroid delta-isomerase